MDTIKGLNRTYMCGSLRPQNIGEKVTLMGWVSKARNMGGLVFVDIRDRSGITQIVFEPDKSELQEKASGLHMEYVIAAVGTVRERSNIVNTSSLRFTAKSLPIRINPYYIRFPS